MAWQESNANWILGVTRQKTSCYQPKGTSTYLLDLEGVKRPTRNKTDILQREKDTHFVFWVMDTENLDYRISTDLVLQPEAYRSMVSVSKVILRLTISNRCLRPVGLSVEYSHSLYFQTVQKDT